MPSRIIAIGDIHGCADALGGLVDAIDPQPDDTIVTLGDCVDRGPDSRGVIDQLLALAQRCRLVPILGNHEEMMLHHLDGRTQPDDWYLCGGDATRESYCTGDGEPIVPQEHVDFIESWIDFWETETHFFVHGAYQPDQPFAGQRWQIWRWQSLRELVPAPHISGKTAVVGHTSQKSGEVLDLGHLVCIDTYCWGGGWLTAIDVASGQLWQVDDQGHARP